MANTLNFCDIRALSAFFRCCEGSPGQEKKKKKERKERREKKGKKEEKKEEEENNKVNYTCPRCGQDPYFCQCKNNVKTMYKYFNPEKDIY